MKEKLILPRPVEKILSRFDEGGYRADIVGGCVRDKLLFKEPNDYDITTNATPDAVKVLFSDCRTVDTGIKHGTVTLLFEGGAYEITTWRVEGKYLDNRRPSSVSFAKDISEDLSRRDFTVNAIAYSYTYGLTDLFGGREDIEAKILRSVRDPTARFREDALRILRALRFSATLGFAIEENTARAIRAEKALLHNISAERIYQELCKLLSGDMAESVLSEYAEVISEVIPAFKTASATPLLPFVTKSTDARLLSLLYRAASTPEERVRISDETLTALRTDGAIRRLAKAVLSLGDAPYGKPKELLRLLYRLGEGGALAYLEMRRALGESTEGATQELSRLLAEGRPYRIRDLAIGGDALLSLGVLPNEIGLTLEKLLFAVIDERVENTAESLMEYCKK